MSEVKDYYGLRQGTTYLEIFSVLEGSGDRVVHRQLRDQEAYDTWHLSLYMKEILAYQRLLRDKAPLRFEQLPRPEKNLLVGILLAAQPKWRQVVELGSSLFEMIDGLELVKRFLSQTHSPIRVPDPHDVDYLGIEISDLLIQAAEHVHREYRLTHVKDCEKLPSRIDVLYDRNVSSYAFQTPKALADLMNRAEVCLMNLFVSKGQTFLSARLGKSLTYFSLAELIEHLERPLYHLFGFKAPGPFQGSELSRGKPVVEGFFLCAVEEDAQAFARMAQSDPAVAAYWKAKEMTLRPAADLLGTRG